MLVSHSIWYSTCIMIFWNQFIILILRATQLNQLYYFKCIKTYFNRESCMKFIALWNISSVKQNRIFSTFYLVVPIHLFSWAMESIHDFGTIFGMYLYAIDKLTTYVTSFDIKLTFYSLEMEVPFIDFFFVRMSCWIIRFFLP